MNAQTQAALKMLELAGEHAQGVLADTTSILELAEGRAAQIPSAPELARAVRSLATHVAEQELRIRMLEQAQADRDQGAKR